VRLSNASDALRRAGKVLRKKRAGYEIAVSCVKDNY
jgi:hypothetical protein